MISLIYQVDKNEETVIVRAIVEDAIEIYPATREDPAEYGPALCESRFTLCEDDELPENDEDLIDYLEHLQLEWVVVNDD